MQFGLYYSQKSVVICMYCKYFHIFMSNLITKGIVLRWFHENFNVLLICWIMIKSKKLIQKHIRMETALFEIIRNLTTLKPWSEAFISHTFKDTSHTQNVTLFSTLKNLNQSGLWPHRLFSVKAQPYSQPKGEGFNDFVTTVHKPCY